MSSEFQTTTHAKWILAGEHAVIRGHAALVFPLLEKTLTLYYKPSDTIGLRIKGSLLDQDPHTTQILLQNVLERSLQHIQRSFSLLKGEIYIESNIPMGVGMGASAALCVAITRWFISQQWVAPNEAFHLARELEHFFHGQSSGLDIVGVSNTQAMYFQNGQSYALNLGWQPKWQLTFCGQKGPTADCVQSVQQLRQQNPLKGQELDQRMQTAVLNAKQALEQSYTPESQNCLIHTIQQAHDCFAEWGLLTPGLQQHIKDLYAKGALAAKPTGSGGGGYVLSFWGAIPVKQT